MSFGKTGSIVERYITRNYDPARTLAIYYLIDLSFLATIKSRGINLSG